MDIIKPLSLVCLTGFVLLTFVVVMAVFAIIGTQSKQQQARRILKAKARDAFADLEMPKNKIRFRLLAGIALFGVLGMAFSFVILFVQMVTNYSKLSWVMIAVALIFGSMSAVAGLLMNREINRRL